MANVTGTFETPETALKIVAAHGSARIYNLAIEQIVDWKIGNDGAPAERYLPTQLVSHEDFLLIPFLSAETEYIIEFKTENGTIGPFSFTTLPSPFSWAPADEALARPGSYISGGCTLSFFFRDATNETVYATTAGHCGGDVGDNVTARESQPTVIINGVNWDDNAFPLGVIVASEFNGTERDGDDEVRDWKLIEISPTARALVSPSTTYWGGPVGIINPNEVAKDDLLCTYGQGQVLRDTTELRPRCFRFAAFSPGDAGNEYQAYGQTNQGDSGAPVIHMESGRAFGTHTASVRGVLTMGVTICKNMGFLAEKEFRLQIATAALSGNSPLATPPPLIPALPSTQSVSPCNTAYIQ